MTDRYGVIGNPVAHSKGPLIHAAFARQTGQDLSYERVLAPVTGFAEAVRRFRDEGGRGLNVTIPFKVEACAYATRLTDRARDAGAVNTLKFDREGALGDNTDGAGLVADIEGRLAFALAGRRVLLVGAGGAARGVAGPILDRGPALLFIVNRTPERARELAARSAKRSRDGRDGGQVFDSREGGQVFDPARVFANRGEIVGGAFDDLADRSFDVVVNATAASLAGDPLPLAASVYAPGALAYDLVYADQPTPFMRFASAHGVERVSDGLGMLVAQAAESFLLWRGVRPDPALVMVELRPAVSAGRRGATPARRARSRVRSTTRRFARHS